MTPPMRIAVLLIVMAGLAFSFSAKDYLYSNESGATITSEDFTYNGTSYSIIKINGVESFLISNDKPVRDEDTIAGVVHGYFLETYYPSQTDLDSVYNYLLAYNKSKNNGERTKNQEENTCRYNTFIDGHVKIGTKPVTCTDDTSCQTAAALLYSYGAEAFGWGSPTQILAPLKNFSYASFGSENLMKDDFDKLSGIDEQNAYDNLKSIKDSIPRLRSYEYDIEHSVFRFPILNDSADVASCKGVCYGLCPPLSFDSTQLDSLDSSLTTLLAKVLPLENEPSIESSIFLNTVARLQTYATEANATYYNSIFLPEAANASATIASAEATLALITNTSLQANLTALKDLHNGINTSIRNRDFDTIDSDLAKYSALIPKVQNQSDAVYAVYNGSLAAKKRAYALIFVEDTKDLDPFSRSQADRLKNDTMSLDSQFKSGLTQEAYASFAQNYTNISMRIESILRSARESPASMVVLSFRSFARKVNSGLADFIGSANLMPLSDVPQKQAETFGVFSLMTLLSLGSLCLLVFLSLLVLHQIGKTSARYTLLIVFIVSLISVTAFASFLYVYLEKTSVGADVGEFMNDVKARNGTVVFLDEQNASSAGKASMSSCGSLLASELAVLNKSISLYTVDSSGCTKQVFGNQSTTTLSVDKQFCLDSLQNASSVILMNYSYAYEKPKFSVIYVSRAYISADNDYYDACPIAGLFNTRTG